MDWKSSGLALTPKARALAPALREMTSPLARIFLRAEKEYDPIFLYYSQPSIQVDWLLESTVDGSTWHRRFSSFEADHNRMAKVRNSWLKAFQDLGYSPRFISELAQGESGSRLAAGRPGVFVFPTARALSREERLYAADLAARGFILLADGTPGLFDEHGRLANWSLSESLFPLARSEERTFAARSSAAGSAASKEGDIAAYSRARLAAEPDMDWAQWISEQVQALPRKVSIPLRARARVHRYTLGDARLLAFERAIDYQVSEELKQAGGNEQLEKPVPMEATLAQPAHVYDLRARKYAGHTDRIVFQLDPWQPSLFALLPQETGEARLIDLLLEEADKE